MILQLVPLFIKGLGLKPPGDAAHILLETEDKTLLSVEIGPGEATALLLYQEEIAPRLPLTHDLLILAFERGQLDPLMLEFTRVTADGPQCVLHMGRLKKELKPWPLRPSDGLILAYRLHIPVMIHPKVLKSWLQNSQLDTFTEGPIVDFPPLNSPTLH